MKKFQLILAALFVCIFFFTGCKKEEYVVTFNPNGGKGAIVTQNFTGKIAQDLMANSFTNGGCAFAGWNTKPDGTGIAYKDQEMIKVSVSMVLYAQWKNASEKPAVTFKANGGVGDMPLQTFEAEVPQALSTNMFVYDNYIFLGWCTAPNGNGKKFENQQIITITSDMTLYAQWKIYANTLFVFFDANEGTGTMNPQAFIEGVTQKLDPNTFTRTDYIFKNWNTKKDGTGYSILDTESVKLYANMMLYAQWM